MLVATTLRWAWCAAELVAQKVKAPCMMANTTNAAKVILSRDLIMQLAYWINKHPTILFYLACGLATLHRQDDVCMQMTVCFTDPYTATRSGEQRCGFFPCRLS